MGGDRFFWLLFGGIWLFVGAAFLAATAGINLFANPAALNRIRRCGIRPRRSCR